MLASSGVAGSSPAPISSAVGAPPIADAASVRAVPSAAPTTLDDSACMDLVPGKTPPHGDAGAPWKSRPPERLQSSARGFDTSGPAPFRTLRDAKFSYGFIQTAVGLQQNKDFERNWAAAKACGIPRGAYQFLSAADGAAQGRAFLQAVGDDHGEVPPILDLEKPPRCSDECCNETCSTWTVRVDQWLATVDAKIAPRKSVLYYVEPFFAQCLCGSTKWKDRTLFLAAWPRFDFPQKPRLGGFTEWTFYQYEGNVLRYGGVIDLSLFAGDTAAFRAWLQHH